MEYIVGALIVIGLVYAIAKMASGDRYAHMTEEEFEAEAQRSSRLGGVVAELQKIYDASHHVELGQAEQESVEADGQELGDRPKAGQSSSRNRRVRPTDEHQAG